LQSITQERDLDEFLNTAQLAGTDFTAGKYALLAPANKLTTFMQRNKTSE
jgi:hypothetical protein